MNCISSFYNRKLWKSGTLDSVNYFSLFLENRKFSKIDRYIGLVIYCPLNLCLAHLLYRVNYKNHPRGVGQIASFVPSFFSYHSDGPCGFGLFQFWSRIDLN